MMKDSLMVMKERTTCEFRHFAVVVAIVLVAASNSSAVDKVTYENEVRPILREHCFACHNQDDPTSSLALDSFEGAVAGGASGEVLAAGDPDGSRLWRLVTHQEEPKMPPDNKVPDGQLQVLRAWIEGGLLKNADSKPIKSNKPAITKLDAGKLGQPVGEPAMPEQLLHEPVLWTPTAGPVDVLATSPWAPLAAIAWQRQISLYDTNNHSLLGIIPYVDGVPRVVRFSRDGSLVLVAGGRHAAAGSAALFDVKTGARLATLGDELDIVLAADISPDLALVAIGGPKKKVRVYRVADGTVAYQISKHTEWITALGFSPDGRLLATADRSGSALLWAAAAGLERADLRGHKGAITSLDWRADAAMLATASEDGTVRLWNPAGQQIKSVNAHPGGALSVRFAKDGNWISAGRDGKVKTWKPDGAAIADLCQMTGMALAAVFTHDGAKVVASDYSGEVRLLDVANKQHVASLSANPPLLAQRLADANRALAGAQQNVQTSKDQLKAQLAALTAAQTAHAAHDEKLAKAQATLAAQQAQYEEFTKLLTGEEEALGVVRQPVEHAATLLAEVSVLLEEAQAKSTADAESERLAALKASKEAAEAAHAAAKQQLQQAEQALQAAAEKQQSSKVSVESAEAVVAQVTNETAGLPDLAKLTEQHTQTKVAVATAEQQLQSAQQTKTIVVDQQARFAEATARYAAGIQRRQAEQQELVKQSERLETEHQQAADALASHRARLTEVANQLKAIQAKLVELESGETALRDQESKLATELAKTQSALAVSQQQIDLLEASKLDFAAAKELRKTYAAKK